MIRCVDEIQKHFDCDLLSHAHNVDQSIFKQDAQIVVYVRDKTELQVLVDLATTYCLPITARGAGTSVAGQAIGRGIVLDFSRHFNRIISYDKQKILLEPGAVLKDVNQFLKPFGRMMGPDPGSQDHCTVGGMMSLNASGPRSLRYKDTRSNVTDASFVLSDGQLYSDANPPALFKDILNIVKDNKTLIEQEKIQTLKNSAGYALHELLNEQARFSQLMCGSEGTLGLIESIEFITHESLGFYQSLVLFYFDEEANALDEVGVLRDFNPISLEYMDHHILAHFDQVYPGRLVRPLKSKACLIAQFDQAPKDLLALYPQAVRIDSPQERETFLSMRKSVSSSLHEGKQKLKPLRCIEDACVPLPHLKNYVLKLRRLLKHHQMDGPVFGHVGQGHVHVNPWVDVFDPNFKIKLEALMDDFYALVIEMKGTISGEHGVGMLRSHWLKKQYPQTYALMEMIKTKLDPNLIFNPDKLFGSLNLTQLKNLQAPWNSLGQSKLKHSFNRF